MSKIKKLGLGIIAFEGTEHLKNITYELRSHCDTIVICLQKLSYHGDLIQQEDIDTVTRLKELGYIDDIIWFEPTDLHSDDVKSGPRLIETDKRNFILDYLEFDKKCSHSMVIDSDEFYDSTDFENAKNFISHSDNIHVTYCQYVNYYRDYRHILVWPYYCYVPFITESSYRFKFKSEDFTKPSDPTRRYAMKNDKVYHILGYQMIKMHHLSWIRKDMKRKISNWSARQLFDGIAGLHDAILDRYNNYTDGQNAIIMFNVPFYEVTVQKLPKQYIHPHFKIYETL